MKLMDSSRSVVQVSTEVVVTRKWMWQVDIATTRAMGENVSDLKPTVRGYCLIRTARLRQSCYGARVLIWLPTTGAGEGNQPWQPPIKWP